MADSPLAEKQRVQRWLSDIAQSRKLESDWRKKGEEIVEIYEGCKKDNIPFNILYSNTETMAPAVYGSVPRPSVGRRFKDDDSLGKAVSEAANRMLSYTMDTNSEEYDCFDDVMKDACLDTLLPGRGMIQFRYDADVYEADKTSGAPPRVENEKVCFDNVDWKCFAYGWAKRWSRVPWIAFEMVMDEDEARKEFKGVASKIKYIPEVASEKESKSGETTSRKVAFVYQIWVKKTRKVLYVSPQYDDGFLDEREDPLDLTGFYPTPKPLTFVRKTGSLIPSSLYVLYENQAQELNDVTRRLNKLIAAAKARGIYDGSIKEIQALLEVDEPLLVPAENAAALQSTQGLNNAVWMWPIEKIVTAIQILYVERENCKKVIYEITGIADILRGVSQASETLGAQQIKQQWGTLRIKSLQKEVQRYARDSMRIMLEIAAKKLSPETWARVTGLPYTSAQEKTVAQQTMQQAQATGQPVPPEVMQTLQQPTWDDVLRVMRDDVSREYRVDIETNSTVDVEATEDRQNIIEIMTVVGQFLQGVAPLIQSGVMPFQVAQSMLLTIVRRFSFGPEIEDYIKAMVQPKPQQQDDGSKQQLAQATLENQGLKQQSQLQAKSAELDKRDADLKVREAALKAAEEIMKIKKVADDQVTSASHELQAHKAKTAGEGALNQATRIQSKVEAKAQGVEEVRRSIEMAMKGLAAMGQHDQRLSNQMQQLATDLQKGLADLGKLVTADRESVPERGKDGKIAKVTSRIRAH